MAGRLAPMATVFSHFIAPLATPIDHQLFLTGVALTGQVAILHAVVTARQGLITFGAAT